MSNQQCLGQTLTARVKSILFRSNRYCSGQIGRYNTSTYTVYYTRCFHRFLWVLAIIGVTSCVIALLYNTMYGQDRYAFSSSIRSQPVVQMAFPAVTVCNLAPYDYNRIEDTPLKNSYDEVRQFLRQVSSSCDCHERLL